MNSSQLISLASLITQDHFLGLEDIQKEIVRNPNDFKIIMNGSKPQWVYLSFEDRKNITGQSNETLEKTEKKAFVPTSQKVSLRKDAVAQKQISKISWSKSVKKMKPLSRDL